MSRTWRAPIVAGIAAVFFLGAAAFPAPAARASSDAPWIATDITPNLPDIVTAYGYSNPGTDTVWADYTNDGSTDYTTSKPVTSDATNFTLPLDVLKAGSHVWVHGEGPGGSATIHMIAAALSIWGVYVSTDVVSGRAPAGMTVTVYPTANSDNKLTAVTDGAGQWNVDFTGTADVTAGMWFTASVSDLDGNETRYQAQPDLQNPTIRLTMPGGALFTLGTSVRISYSGTDNVRVANYDVAWRRAPYNAGFGAYVHPTPWQRTTLRSVTLTGLVAGYEYCLTVRARDAAGNVSPWAAPVCVSRPLDDRSLFKTSAWTRYTDSRYYLSTYTAARAYGAPLTRPGAQSSRLAVVATKCPGCGTIYVYVGTTRVAAWSLNSTTTTRKVVLVSSSFSLRTGTVTIKVVSSGRTVQIDGLGVRRV